MPPAFYFGQVFGREVIMAGVAAVFLDGGHLDKVMHYDFGDQRIDYEKLVQHMAQPAEMLRAYYYHCLPY